MKRVPRSSSLPKGSPPEGSPGVQYGISIPPYTGGARRGEIAVTVDKLLWSSGSPPAHVFVTSQWWGERSPGAVRFRPALSMEQQHQSTAVFPVVTSKDSLAAYLRDMGEGFELFVMVDIPRQVVLGRARLSFAKLCEEKYIEGWYPVLAEGALTPIARLRAHVALRLSSGEPG
eukprot:RCo047341